MAANNEANTTAQCSDKLSCYIKKFINKFFGQPQQKPVSPAGKEDQASSSAEK
jgi:hypothetical protein